VVIGNHENLASAALAAALGGPVGYIGLIGPLGMRSLAEWLAYRGIHDVTRVYEPAGLNIRAHTHAEIAVSIMAQAVSVQPELMDTPAYTKSVSSAGIRGITSFTRRAGGI
jgi:xanthine/CO dehydrogenase XdhC/CoxF family maturation factor